MAKKQQSNVDPWLKGEIPRTRKALESASKYFDSNDTLTVNTLEAVYGQESSFGTRMRERGSSSAAGHFHLEPATARQYGLSVTRTNDQRFNIDYASSAAARYLKDLNSKFSKKTTLLGRTTTIAVKNPLERKNLVLAAFNGGEGRVADAQRRAEMAGKDPQLWDEVKKFLKSANTKESKANEMKQYVEKVLFYEDEFALKSPTDKNLKHKEVRKGKYRCTEGHWVTIDGRPVFICD